MLAYIMVAKGLIIMDAPIIARFILQGYASNLPPLDRVTILGVPSQPSSVAVNGETTTMLSYDATAQSLLVGPGLKIPMSQQFTLTWQ